MRTKNRFTAISCFTLLGVLLASCAPAAAPTPTPRPPAPVKAPAATPTAAATPKPAAPAPTPKPAGEQPRYGGILTVGVGGDPPSFDPHRESAMYSAVITSSAYNRVVKYDPLAWPEVKVIPDLTTSWDVSPDGKVYTFNLVKGAKFHDGTPLTAEDVRFSFDRIRDPKLGLTNSPRRHELANITSIDTPDDYTVKITLGYPQASFIPIIAIYYFAVMPKRVVLEKKGDMTQTMVGTGPFKFKDYASGAGWELVKNPNYFVAGRPYLDAVKGYIIRDQFTRFAALRTKNVLWWMPFPYMTMSQAKVIQDTLSDKISFKLEVLPAWYGVAFNVTKPPWSDARLRQAVSLTFDRKRMLQVVLEGAGRVGMAAQPPGEWTLPEDEMMKVPGYAKPDLEGAKRLLAEAGFPNGFKTEALVKADRTSEGLSVLFKDAVAPIGITVDLNVAEQAVFNDRQFRRAFDAYASSQGHGIGDPDVTLGDSYLTGSGLNYSGYSNPYYDDLYLKQKQTLDVGERRKIVWEMQRILLKDVPVAIAFWANTPYAWWKDVRGFNPPSIGHRHSFDFTEFWLAR
ncbi:MAG: ABC transporter substrate-binding protein [Chloroflexi bacterium]|nr:ABC transporter substrate-binding protein [Chloroflexota bacterium]